MNGLDSAQIERLKQISEYLYHHRQEAGLSLEKIAQQTFIPLRLLEALESGQIERLPEPVYIRGFIRRYADAVGLDGTEIADAFPIEPDSLAQAAPAETNTLPEQPLPDRLTDSTHRHSEPESNRPAGSYLPWVAGIGAVAVGAIALALFNPFKSVAPSSTASLSSPQSAVAPSSRPPALKPLPTPEVSKSTAIAPSPILSPTPAVSPSPVLSPSLAASPNPDPQKTADASPMQLDVSLTDRSWISVVADGKTEFEGMMDKGSKQTWTARKNLMLRAGNAGAVIASFNQGAAKPLGKAGDVVDVEYPKP